MTAHIKRSGKWTTVKDLYVKRSGTWAVVDEGWVKQNGTWKIFHKRTFEFTITGTKYNANLRSLAVSAGWDGKAKVIATIASTANCVASTTGNYGLTINGSFPQGVELINNGKIIGKGGQGGRGTGVTIGSGGGTYSQTPTNGTAGGPGLLVSVAVRITNNGIISGGGGGGGGARGLFIRQQASSGKGGGTILVNLGMYGGGGGGGGCGNGPGGAGGPIQTSGSAGPAGKAGSLTTYGAGGSGTTTHSKPTYTITFASGARGGTYGAAGLGTNSSNYPKVNGAAVTSTAGSAALKLIYTSNTSGGAGGIAINGNSRITWAKTGTRYGTIK